MARLREAELIAGMAARDRAVLARIITLFESERPADRVLAEAVLDAALVAQRARASRAMRVGITGPPGVGKSTLIEALGVLTVERGASLAVLAVDPSSQATGGSILGDKTRMPTLATLERAFVRPSPSGKHLGGVAARTREALSVCEAFGFDVVIVETVGVGQSETEVATMVDTFVLLAQPGAGDELQGMKRGIMELCDLVVVNKADGEHLGPAREAASELRAALRLFGPRPSGLVPEVLLASALRGEGIGELHAALAARHARLSAGTWLSLRDAEDRRRLFHTLLGDRLQRDFRAVHGERVDALTRAVTDGDLTPTRALAELFGSPVS